MISMFVSLCLIIGKIALLTLIKSCSCLSDVMCSPRLCFVIAESFSSIFSISKLMPVPSLAETKTVLVFAPFIAFF